MERWKNTIKKIDLEVWNVKKNNVQKTWKKYFERVNMETYGECVITGALNV